MQRLILMAILLTLSCAGMGGPSKLTPEELLANRIQEYFRRCEAFGFSGALLVVKVDVILVHRGYGFANRQQSIPVTSAVFHRVVAADRSGNTNLRKSCGHHTIDRCSIRRDDKSIP
jgi:hypothetical protein